MKRREFMLLLAAAACPLRANVQAAAGKRYRLGILETIPAESNGANLDALYRGLRELGYVEGQNLSVEYRSAEGRAERFPELVAELVAKNVDIIVTRGTPAALAAKESPGNVPVVMAAIGEPLGVGVVAELARPGGKVTGLSAFSTELAGKRVELLRAMMLGLKRLGFVNNMTNPVVPPQWDETRRVAKVLGLEALLLDVRKRDDIGRAFETAGTERIDAIAVGLDTVTQANRRLIIDLAAKHRIPAMYASREFMHDGGLIAYGVSYVDLYFRTAAFIDKILKGAKPGDLPIEPPAKFETAVNLKTAKAIGFTIPDSFLVLADEVIE